MKPERPYFPLLDPLRGFAAITVVVYHVIEITDWKDFPQEFGLQWFKWGWMGVDIFFVLSGFVITLSALNILSRHNRYRDALREYAVKRIKRVLPLHYLTLCIYLWLFAEIWNSPDIWANIASHLLFIHNWFPAWHRGLNAPNWTLAVEAQFYILLIILVPYVRTANLKYFILGAFAIAFGWRAWAYHALDANAPDFMDKVFMTATQLPGMLDFFACGMFLAFFAQTQIFHKLRELILFRCLLAGAIIILWLFAFDIFKSNQETYWLTAWTVIWPRSLLAILASMLILFLCCFPIRGRGAKFLMPLVFLGVISYGIYLMHWPILLTLKKYALAPWQTLSMTLGLTLLAATASWIFYERRFLGSRPYKRDD